MGEHPPNCVVLAEDYQASAVHDQDARECDEEAAAVFGKSLPSLQAEDFNVVPGINESGILLI